MSLIRRRGGGCEHTNRGLDRLEAVLRSAGLPGLVETVADRARPGRRVKLLEIGCGEGRLLLDLMDRCGDEVELHGINHPDWPVALDARLRTPPKGEARRLPTIHLADAQDLAGFPVDGFDLIVSQVVLPHVARKDRALEESARLLARGGTFLHEIDNLDGREPAFLATDLPRLSVHDESTRVPATAHLLRCGVGVHRGRSGDRTVVLATYRKGDASLDLGLAFDEAATVVLKSLAALDLAHRWGIRSEYRLATSPTAPRAGSEAPPAPPA